MYTTIFDTTFAKQYGLTKQAKDTAAWFNLSYIPDTTPDQYIKLIQNISPVVKSPLAEIFILAKRTHVFDKFNYVSYLNHPNTTLPEILTLQDLSIYGKHITNNAACSGTWINLMPMLSKGSSRYAPLTITSTNKLIALLVRGMLCMSYDDNKNWATPKTAIFLLEFYAQVMNLIFDRMFKLTTEESGLIKLVFAYRYALLLNPKRENNVPILVTKSKHLFRELQDGVDRTLNLLASEVGSSTKMEDYVAFLIEHGPARLNKLTERMIYGAVSISATSSVSSWIAADYPPYLMYLILGTLSSIRNPIISTVIDKYFTVKYIRTAIEGAIKNKSFYAGMK